MSCSPFDLRDYFLKELADPQQRLVEGHVKICQQCREELDRLRIAEAALFSLRDEEIPQRIAFVSDKIFEPSPWRRWLASFWGSSARLGFAAAAMLSVAVVVNAFRPAPLVLRPGTTATVKTVSEDEIRQRIQAAVDKAIPAIEARYAKRADEMVKAVEYRDQQERKRILALADAAYDRQQKEVYAAQMTAYNRAEAPQ